MQRAPHGPLAQLAVHLPCKQAVKGSSPLWSTEAIGVWRSLAARCVRDAEVAGSNPATPTDGLKGRWRPAWFGARRRAVQVRAARRGRPEVNPRYGLRRGVSAPRPRRRPPNRSTGKWPNGKAPGWGPGDRESDSRLPDDRQDSLVKLESRPVEARQVPGRFRGESRGCNTMASVRAFQA